MANLLSIVSYKVFPAHMGGQKGIVNFYKYLQQIHQVCMAVSFDNAGSDHAFTTQRVLFPHAKMGLNLLQVFRLRKLVLQHKIDAVVAEHSYTGWIALLLKKLTG
ncbi:MAG TPA: hypothetical protein VFL47_11150, partial [Flavisolibacter sp.]|nr:hypothetical protein [Flavisolibacter sp.]